MANRHRLTGVFNRKPQNVEYASKVGNREEIRCQVLGCKGEPLITDDSTGEIICGFCGSILVERSIATDSERARDFDEFLTKARTGPGQSLSMYDMGIMTVMSNKDAMGKSLSSPTKDKFNRLKRLDNRSKTSSNRTLRTSLLMLDSLKTKLAIPDSTVESAAYIYRKAMQKKITIGRSAKSLMCASIYAACRQAGIPRSIHDLAQATGIGRKEVSRDYRKLTEELELDLAHCNAAEFVAKIATEVNISEQIRREALKLLQKLSDKGLTDGKNPMVLAASTLYLCCVLNDEYKTQNEIAKAAGVTAVSVRTRYQALKKSLEFRTDKFSHRIYGKTMLN
ncbi:MAG: transcription initiation factor IIB [Nitrosotalea sp.]